MISTLDILTRLIAFDTTSRNSNRQLMDYICGLLSDHGIKAKLIPNADGSKANLYATIGPDISGGIMLSGHTDVVPVDGQDWTKPPFTLTEDNSRLYGRGTADMKGFIASVLAMVIRASEHPLPLPLHLAFSYDEEIGCVGVRSMIDMLEQAPHRPAMCIVGEPTELGIATRHKGKISVLARCIGRAGHSALAPNALNAIHLACDLVSILRQKQQEIVSHSLASNATPNSSGTPGPSTDSADSTEIPYTTVHVGGIHAGQALNIVPNLCTVNFEIRNASEDDPELILDDIKRRTEAVVQQAQLSASEAAVEFEIWNSYPGLDTAVDAPIVDFVKSLLGINSTTYVAFGTEGGLFSQKLSIPTVVCGPGSMAQGHKPDEFIEVSQLARCDQMLQQLLQHMQNQTLPA